MSRPRARPRAAVALAALALLAVAAIAVAAVRSGRARIDPNGSASAFHEPSVSPSCTPSRLNVSAALAGA